MTETLMTDFMLKNARARRAEDARRVALAAGINPQSSESICSEIANRAAEVAAGVAEKQQRLREWLALQPQTDECPVHGIERAISFDESHRTQTDFAKRARHVGPSNGQFFAEYLCPTCHREAGFGRWRSIGIPSKYWGASLDDLSYSTAKCQSYLGMIRKFDTNPRGFLLLIGNPGTGKTHAACAILGRLGRGWFVSQSDLIDAHRRTYRDEAAEIVRDKAMRTPLLVLDEIGVATGGNDASALLFDVINSRYANKRPTILTSNLPREELLRTLGNRIVDRIEEAAFAVLRFDEPSNRKQANGDYLEGFEV